MPNRSTPEVSRVTSGFPLFIALVLVISFFIGTATVEYFNSRTLLGSGRLVTHTHEVVESLQGVLSLLTDAETGQRGFIITGDEKYLDPYNVALNRIDEQVALVTQLTADNPAQQVHIPALKEQIAIKEQELADVINLRRTGGFEAAQARVATDRGKIAMDKLRAEMALMEQEEKRLLDLRFAQTDTAFGAAVRGAITSGVLGVVLAVGIASLLRRTAVARQRQQWLQTGQTRLGEKVIGEQHVAEVGENALRFLCEYLHAKAGALFVDDGAGFRRCATYAVSPTAGLPERFAPGEGLLGQAVKDARPFLVRDVPENYLTIGSGLGQSRSRELLIAPTKADNKVNGVLELGFFEPVNEDFIELLNRCSELIGIAVHSAQSRAQIMELLEETQRQSEEMQTQAEELRVSNEELEEQSRALKQTQTQLEQQQAELEQTNLQLEEQTRQLEVQKDDLTQAKQELEQQARVVEQASRYKSDFLANMSHELRTPLNSSLILAQLLAENRSGNLTEEQVKFARTIQGSGNDLLSLINDVLDLSKIEAGRMDLKPQPVTVAGLLETLRRQFDPIAQNRGLALSLRAAPGAPEQVETDPLRLEQILRNLLSNALKFTDQGEVVLEVGALSRGRISFAVRDTGIGIDTRNQRVVFEPFVQADGTTNRKYGGTGLGLSISRELARLLGGEIQLASELGKGSTFTLSLPKSWAGGPREVALPALPPASPRALPSMSAPRRSAASPAVADDRERLSGARIILVVEDDTEFAEVLANLAREQNFQCLVTASAQEAVELAREHLPNAVVLDIGLPDGSGLFVLDRLKHDPRTRHIPVHVVSGSDYAEKALGMGAVGYMIKPVPREKLVEAFQDLEKRLTRQLHRVLVVEDDATQRSALCELLSSREVEATGAQDASHCLDELRRGTFDCMVLDLSLPDASGFALLETISTDETYPFPPVIIYTGRELSPDEEQKLRRYSKSIIIKGAKSPERLLDEVALFLHQVVADLPVEQQRMIEKARSRDAALEGRRVLIAEDDVRNVYALTSLLEPFGLKLEIARNGKEALAVLDRVRDQKLPPIDLVLMDIMMPEMDGLTAMRRIRERPDGKKLPIIALTAKAMPDDQAQCLAAGANDYLPKPLDVEKLLSLVRVWMPR